MSELYKERSGETRSFVPFLKTKTDQVDDVDSLYAKIQKKNIPIKIDLRDEPWGDRHLGSVCSSNLVCTIV